MSREQEKRANELMDDDEEFVDPGVVQMMDASFGPPLSALGKFPAIAAAATGLHSGYLRTFSRNLARLVFKYVPGPQGSPNPLPRTMLVYHGPMPTEAQPLTAKQLLQSFSDKLYYSLWVVSGPGEYDIVRLSRTFGNETWPSPIDIMVSDLEIPMYFEETEADAIDELLTKTFELTDEGRPKTLPAGGSTGSGSSRPPSRPDTRPSSPVGTRSAAMERELLNEKARAASAIAEANQLRARLDALESGGSGGHTPTAIPTPLTQLPFNPALLATDPTFIAAMAAAFRYQGAAGGGGVPGMSTTWPATVVNVSSTQSETKRQNAYRVGRIRGLFEPGKFDNVWKALDVDSAGVTSSYNMEYSQDIIREILTTKQGRHAREPTSKFLLNASLFLFDSAEGLALEHFLGPKEAIGGNWDEFAKAWSIMTNLYGEYFGETLAAALRKYWFELFELHYEFESLAVEALVHLAQRTLSKLRQVGDRSSRSAGEYIRNVLRVDRADQEVIDMLHREQFAGEGRGHKRERGKRERGLKTHPANLDRLDDSDSEESAAHHKKGKGAGKPRPMAPRLVGPPPCYLWVAGKCAGTTCTQPPTRHNKIPHPHAFDKRDKGTPAQKDFQDWVKKYF
jgi:hypothetical protein